MDREQRAEKEHNCCGVETLILNKSAEAEYCKKEIVFKENNQQCESKSKHFSTPRSEET